jgi:hypothetical protein
MKPSAYISDGGILFKESPPDSILKLNPLYTSAEIQALHNLVKEQPIVKEQPQTDLIVLLREEVTLMQKYLQEQNLREHFVTWRQNDCK